MNTTTLRKYKLFLAWQDEKEEAWLESMSRQGWHLRGVGLPFVYTFEKGAPLPYTYRLDFMTADKKSLPDYLQLFQDAGWEYLGELSSWRYWRKLAEAGETPEIFSDTDSKVKKYQRLLFWMAFLLFLLVFLGFQLFTNARNMPSSIPWIQAIYTGALVCYAVLIPIYIVIVAKLLQRVNQLKRAAL